MTHSTMGMFTFWSLATAKIKLVTIVVREPLEEMRTTLKRVAMLNAIDDIRQSL